MILDCFMFNTAANGSHIYHDVFERLVKKLLLHQTIIRKEHVDQDAHLNDTFWVKYSTFQNTVDLLQNKKLGLLLTS